MEAFKSLYRLNGLFTFLNKGIKSFLQTEFFFSTTLQSDSLKLFYFKLRLFDLYQNSEYEISKVFDIMGYKDIEILVRVCH